MVLRDLVNEAIQIVRRIVPILISHHPMCSRFHGDTFGLFGRRICLGCATVYPIALSLIVLDILFRWDRAIPTLFLHKDLLIASCIFLGSLQMLKYISPPDTKFLRIAVKVALGLAIGGVFVWIFTLPTLFLVQMALFIAFSSASALLASYRYNYLRSTCAGCIYHGDWDICFGFRTLNQHCRIPHDLRGRALRSLIFDRSRKQRLESKGTPQACVRSEPGLEDPNIWLYHEPGYSIFWLPRTGLEVTDQSEVPR
jgi:hypothetical protein